MSPFVVILRWRFFVLDAINGGGNFATTPVGPVCPKSPYGCRVSMLRHPPWCLDS